MSEQRDFEISYFSGYWWVLQCIASTIPGKWHHIPVVKFETRAEAQEWVDTFGDLG